MTLTESGVLIPQGWIAWAAVSITLDASTVAVGEGLRWAVSAGASQGAGGTSMLRDGTQTLTLPVIAPSGTAASEALLVGVGVVDEVADRFGESFTPLGMSILAVGIRIQQGGWPPSVVD